MFARIMLGLCFQMDKMFISIGSESPGQAEEPTTASFGPTAQTGATETSSPDPRGRTPSELSWIAPLANIPEE
jgi:hypothetical protein